MVSSFERQAERLGLILRAVTPDLAFIMTVRVYLKHFIKVNRVPSCLLLLAIIICVQPSCLLQTLDES